MRTGIIDVGGGMRGVYASGVFDWCLERGVSFDVCVGVSAGSANITSFLSNQKGRNFRFYHEYSFRRQYMGLSRFILKGSFVDLDYVYGTLCNSDAEFPLDYATLRDSAPEMYVIATDALTGEAKYFTKSDMKQDDYSILKASSAIPYFCRPCIIDGVPYYDGALSDPVPVKKAFDCGCDKVVLVLTKPADLLRTSESDEKYAAKIAKKYPNAAKALCLRAKRYNEGVALAKEYRKEGKVLIISPDDTCGVDTLRRDRVSLERLYQKGVRDAEAIADFLETDKQ